MLPIARAVLLIISLPFSKNRGEKHFKKKKEQCLRLSVGSPDAGNWRSLGRCASSVLLGIGVGNLVIL